MADIDESSAAKLLRFADYHMKTNPNGIGTQCTHFVYAGLFEINAADGAVNAERAANATVRTRESDGTMVWGTKLSPKDTRPGDIAQFRDATQRVFLFSKGGGTPLQIPQRRGPNHTGIMINQASHGLFDDYEAHLKNNPSLKEMAVRTGRIYYESFAISIPESRINDKSSSLMTYLRQNRNDLMDLYDAVTWGELRDSYGVNPLPVTELMKINGGSDPPGVAIHFQVDITGSISFYRPNISNRRTKMSKSEKESEKQHVIAMMKVGNIKADNYKWDFRDQ